MIGVWASQAQNFLLILGGATCIAFSIPIALTPLKWAKLFLWELPASTDLAIYFGRCLGAFALILDIFMLRAALTGEAIHFVFELMMLVWLFMIVVHISGALQRIQPITETIEIILWITLALLTAAFWPAAF